MRKNSTCWKCGKWFKPRGLKIHQYHCKAEPRVKEINQVAVESFVETLRSLVTQLGLIKHNVEGSESTTALIQALAIELTARQLSDLAQRMENRGVR